MTFVLQPWQLLFPILSGWVNRYQQQVIDFIYFPNYGTAGKPGKKENLAEQ